MNNAYDDDTHHRPSRQPPKKGKKSKKSKAQEEAERAAAEEAARIAAEEEEARLEEERARLAAEAERRRAEEDEKLRVEGIRLAEERAALAPFFRSHASRLQAGRQERLSSMLWERYRSCNLLPDPSEPKQIVSFLKSPVMEVEVGSSSSALLSALTGVCDDMKKIMREARYYELEARALQSDCGDAMEFAQLRQSLVQRTVDAVDEATAAVLARPDEYADEDAGLQLACQADTLTYGLWVNMVKNPRLKTVEFPSLKMSLDLPKPIALGNVALRVMHLECGVNGFDLLSPQSCNQLAACGGVLNIELMTMNPPPKHVKGWTIRHASAKPVLHKQPYPTPPAGSTINDVIPQQQQQQQQQPASTSAADATEPTAATAAAGASSDAAASAAVVSESAPKASSVSSASSSLRSGSRPVGVTMELPRNYVVMSADGCPLSSAEASGAPRVQMALWNAAAREWTTDTSGISDVKVDMRERRISFSASRLAPMAVVTSRTALLPYERWHLRPVSIELNEHDQAAVGTNAATTGASTTGSASAAGTASAETASSSAAGAAAAGPEGGEYPIYEDEAYQEDDAAGACVLTVYVPPMREHFVFRVNGSGARLLAPRYPELEGLIGSTMQPRELLMRLSNCGLHLMPSDADLKYCSGGASSSDAAGNPAMVMEGKDSSLERVACEDISLIAPTCQVGSSAWNRRAECGRERALFRMSEIVDSVRATHRDTERVFEKDKAHAISRVLREEKGAVVLKAGAAEADTAWDAADSIDGQEYHASSLVIAKNILSEAGYQRVERASPMVASNVKDLMLAMRLFSFG